MLFATVCGIFVQRTLLNSAIADSGKYSAKKKGKVKQYQIFFTADISISFQHFITDINANINSIRYSDKAPIPMEGNSF